jgi:hypothetical protein
MNPGELWVPAPPPFVSAPASGRSISRPGKTIQRIVSAFCRSSAALLVTEDGRRIAEASDEEIWAGLDSHRRAVMRPLLRTPEFRAACHKAAVLPELNGRKWLRSFAVYDEWQQSAFSNEAVQPLSRRERRTCQDCHMPRANGLASHRWPGGNTAIPNYYGWPEQEAAVRKFLQSSGISVDIFALRPAGSGEAKPAAFVDGGTVLSPGATVEVDVVVANRGVGHSFPAEPRDIFEAWLEFEARDASGRVLAHSGAARQDGTLEPGAHAYRTVPIDSQGRPITRHEIWNTRVAAFDRHIPAGRADLGRFRVSIPEDVAGPVTLTARLNYRRFNRAYWTSWPRRCP